MQSQGQEWVDRVTTLSCCKTWFMVDRQFWPRLGYGICNNTASWDKLELCLKQVYWQLLPKGGIWRTEANGSRLLWRGLSSPRCQMSCCTNYQTPDTLWMSFRHWFRNVRFDGVTHHGTGTVLPATLQIVLEVQHLGQSYLALFSVGEGG